MSTESRNERSQAQTTRRAFLWRYGGGLGGVALAGLLGSEGLLASADSAQAVVPKARPRLPQFPARAKRVIQLYMSGAASQCDTFDYKPLLIERHGEKWDPGEQVELFQSTPGATLASPWKWRRYGQSGKMINDCVAPLGDCVDDIAFVHNMVSKSNVHGPAIPSGTPSEKGEAQWCWNAGAEWVASLRLRVCERG